MPCLLHLVAALITLVAESVGASYYSEGGMNIQKEFEKHQAFMQAQARRWAQLRACGLSHDEIEDEMRRERILRDHARKKNRKNRKG